MKQQLGGLGVIDTLTARELKEELGHQFDSLMRDMYRGEKLMRTPIIRATATSANVNVSQVPGNVPCGPDQGYIWRVHRAMVTSNDLTDVARYLLYNGSDPTAFDQIHLLDGITFAATEPVTRDIAVANPGTGVNFTYTLPYPAQILSISGNYQNGSAGNEFPNVQIQDNTGAQIAQIPLGQVNAATTIGFYLSQGSFSQASGGTNSAFVPMPNLGVLPAGYKVFIGVGGTDAVTGVHILLAVTNTNIGQNVNIAYTPSQRSAWLFPGEQLYASVNDATTGYVYSMTGIISEVPAEMIGKFL